MDLPVELGIIQSDLPVRQVTADLANAADHPSLLSVSSEQPTKKENIP